MKFQFPVLSQVQGRNIVKIRISFKENMDSFNLEKKIRKFTVYKARADHLDKKKWDNLRDSADFNYGSETEVHKSLSLSFTPLIVTRPFLRWRIWEDKNVMRHSVHVSCLYFFQGSKIAYNYRFSRRFPILVWCSTFSFVHFELSNM